MGGNWSEKDLGRVGQAQCKPRSPVLPRGPNKTEQAYSEYLKIGSYMPDEQGRLVTWYAFEAIKIRIGVRCWLTPDFLVQYDGRTLELHDVKGTKHDTYYAEEDAIVKARAVGAHFPLPIFFVFKLRNGEWGKVRM
jgi:hypothetical protein